MTCVIEKTATGYSAFIEEVPGCVVAAETLKEVDKLMREALYLHFEDNLQAIPITYRSHKMGIIVMNSTVPIVAT
jgi:predicted RNase H-like HicB family nuclease